MNWVGGSRQRLKFRRTNRAFPRKRKTTTTEANEHEFAAPSEGEAGTHRAEFAAAELSTSAHPSETSATGYTAQGSTKPAASASESSPRLVQAVPTEPSHGESLFSVEALQSRNENQPPAGNTASSDSRVLQKQPGATTSLDIERLRAHRKLAIKNASSTTTVQEPIINKSRLQSVAEQTTIGAAFSKIESRLANPLPTNIVLRTRGRSGRYSGRTQASRFTGDLSAQPPPLMTTKTRVVNSRLPHSSASAAAVTAVSAPMGRGRTVPTASTAWRGAFNEFAPAPGLTGRAHPTDLFADLEPAPLGTRIVSLSRGDLDQDLYHPPMNHSSHAGSLSGPAAAATPLNPEPLRFDIESATSSLWRPTERVDRMPDGLSVNSTTFSGDMKSDAMDDNVVEISTDDARMRWMPNQTALQVGGAWRPTTIPVPATIRPAPVNTLSSLQQRYEMLRSLQNVRDNMNAGPELATFPTRLTTLRPDDEHARWLLNGTIPQPAITHADSNSNEDTFQLDRTLQ